MKKSFDTEIVQDISAEMGVNPTFVEKDWYAVQLITTLQNHQPNISVNPVFAGGTSLSKGYSLIQRFSEDLDFFVQHASNVNISQGQRRTYRRNIINHITANNDFSVDDDSIQRGDRNRFFKAPIEYPRTLNEDFIRPHLQLEMTFHQPKLAPILKPIKSIIAEHTGKGAETEVLCVSPLETAADKFSALAWRIVNRDRSSNNDDPTIIRHLHDLATLHPSIQSDQSTFTSMVYTTMQEDGTRGENNIPIPGRIEQMMTLLKNDAMYQAEYNRFVASMSYADADDQTGFQEAFDTLEEIAKIV